jgi:hypothetical protein
MTFIVHDLLNYLPGILFLCVPDGRLLIEYLHSATIQHPRTIAVEWRRIGIHFLALILA